MKSISHQKWLDRSEIIRSELDSINLNFLVIESSLPNRCFEMATQLGKINIQIIQLQTDSLIPKTFDESDIHTIDSISRMQFNIIKILKMKLAKKEMQLGKAQNHERMLSEMFIPVESTNQLPKLLESKGKKFLLASKLDESLDKLHSVQRLDKEVNQIHHLFRDMSSLTVNQNEVFNRIEHQINSSYTNIQIGKDDLEHALDYHKQYKKRTFQMKVAGVVAAVGVGLAIS
mmetsp:Transcript_31357/g.36924  ORF Transcript_31357/g.36924 Transcript_31357/m.36924 type:complete len:231 (-) Transcript_31357:120-812(-)